MIHPGVHDALGTKYLFRLLPWMGCRHAFVIAQVLARSSNVLEYGTGGSTIWMAQLLADSQARLQSGVRMPKRSRGRLTTVEADETWQAQVRKAYDALRGISCLPLADVAFLHRSATGDAYSLACEDGYDIILVDGEHLQREACIDAAFDKLVSGGTLFVHDSEEHLYQRAIARFCARGGVKVYEDSDALFYRPIVRLWQGTKP